MRVASRPGTGARGCEVLPVPPLLREVILRLVDEPDPDRHQLYEEMYAAYVKAYEGLQSSGAFAALAAAIDWLSPLPPLWTV